MTAEENTSFDFQIVWYTSLDEPETRVPRFTMPIDHVDISRYNILDNINVRMNFLPSNCPKTASGINLNWNGNYTRLGGVSTDGSGGISDEPELLFIPFKSYIVNKKEGIDGHFIKDAPGNTLDFWWTYDNYDDIILNREMDEGFKIILSFSIHG